MASEARAHAARDRSAGAKEGVRMADQYDVTLEDGDLLVEVELTTNLIIAATASDERLSVEEIDRILGVSPA